MEDGGQEVSVRGVWWNPSWWVSNEKMCKSVLSAAKFTSVPSTFHDFSDFQRSQKLHFQGSLKIPYESGLGGASEKRASLRDPSGQWNEQRQAIQRRLQSAVSRVLRISFPVTFRKLLMSVHYAKITSFLLNYQVPSFSRIHKCANAFTKFLYSFTM